MKLKLRQLAKKLNKSITDISKETGLNRNTVSALYNNRVDGIKFDTLEKICEVYNLKMEDVLEMEDKDRVMPRKEKIYVQEGEIVPFNIFPGLVAIQKMPKDYFSQTFGKMYAYAKENYLTGFWNENAMNKVAEEVYERYGNGNELDKLFKIFSRHAQNLENLYFTCNSEYVTSMDNEELAVYFNQVWQAYQKFWQFSIFIDSFDPGFDQKKIKEIAEQNNLSKEEISILTTPAELTFNNERVLALLEIIKKVERRKFFADKLDAFLKNFVEFDSQVEKYRLNFDYYKSNYAVIEHITDQEIIDEIKKYLIEKKQAALEYAKLKSYTKNQSREIEKIIRKHKLDKNPLDFFYKLTYWREYRKKVNLMGFHILDAILNSMEVKTGISKKYLHYLIFEEVEHVLKGLISPDTLMKRRNDGMMVVFEGDSYKILMGEEAISIKNELEQKINSEKEIQNTFSGQVASRGYAKGIAKVVLDKNDFSKVNEGDILVTGMTRPEFLPVIKKASAIVTNEGGITCHAAIVSRELGKPCIIGTKFATKLIKDGDLVEVRANHGTVRIIQLD